MRVLFYTAIVATVTEAVKLESNDQLDFYDNYA
jgi:hypothetical protein